MNTILETFKNSRRILCICPCCGEIHRLSDLNLKYKGKVQKSWLDTYDCKVLELEKKEDEFAQKEREIRNQAAERGRKKVDNLIKASLVSNLTKFKYNPYDIKAILHPIDFIVFDGLNTNSDIDVTLLCKDSNGIGLLNIQKDIEKAVKSNMYDWKVARVMTGGNIEYE